MSGSAVSAQALVTADAMDAIAVEMMGTASAASVWSPASAGGTSLTPLSSCVRMRSWFSEEPEVAVRAGIASDTSCSSLARLPGARAVLFSEDADPMICLSAISASSWTFHHPSNAMVSQVEALAKLNGGSKPSADGGEASSFSKDGSVASSAATSAATAVLRINVALARLTTCGERCL